MSKSTLAFVLIIASWSLTLFTFIAWFQHAEMGSFWHTDDGAVYATLLNSTFITILMYLDESFGLRDQS